MKIICSFLAGLILATSAVASDFVTLSKSNPSVSVSPTDVVVIVGTSELGKTESSNRQLWVTVQNEPTEQQISISGIFWYNDTFVALSSPIGNTFTNLTCLRFGGYNPETTPDQGFVTLRILQKGEELVSNPVLLPAAADSRYEISLESSTDLQNWSPAAPGEYLGSSTQRFFRVKAVLKEEEAP